MTVKELIDRLETFRKKHGDDCVVRRPLSYETETNINHILEDDIGSVNEMDCYQIVGSSDMHPPYILIT